MPSQAAAREPGDATVAGGLAASPEPTDGRVTLQRDDKAQATVVSAEESANLSALGRIVWLMSLSPQHKHLFLADLEWRVKPPLLLKQCRLVQRGGRPLAFVSWALISEEVMKRLQETPGQRLRPDEWRCGNNLVVIDAVAPFGNAKQTVEEVMRTVRAANRPAAPGTTEELRGTPT